MNLSEITQTKGWKQFMAKVYGIGASVVLIGAMFKIMHWTGSGTMLVVGLSTEAFIFFTSAFEPLHQEWDWSLVYPELAGMHDVVEDTDDKKPHSKESALEKFDALIEKAVITPDLFDRLGNGLRNLNQTTEKLADVSDATSATNNYVANFERASVKVNEFAESYGKSADTLVTSANNLSTSINKSADNLGNSSTRAAEIMVKTGEDLAQKVLKSGEDLTGLLSDSGKKVTSMLAKSTEEVTGMIAKRSADVTDLVTKSGQELAASYARLSDTMNKEFNSSTEGNKSYGQQLEVMTKNLTALNAVYELQLSVTNEHLDASKKLYGGLEQMMGNLKESVDDSKRYREEISKLSENLSLMNVVYGNMLTAMNVQKHA